ncbi:MAG: radical SAM protein [Candidatus Omnitrophica bacterium]|nr:radical SAM protein [Candidatus Omnitrophota bacterium]MDD5070367.1 radical SAM protein [Candidatus Omnitrophota bacterium]
MLQVLNQNNTFGKFPIVVRWLLNDSCNLNCAHCSYIGSKLVRKKTLSTEAVLSILGNLSNYLQIGELQFLGGEPLLRDDYRQIIGCAVGRRIPTSLITNGTLADSKFYEFLSKTPLAQVTFSIDGIDEVSYGGMRKPGIFNRLIKNLQKAIQFKHPLTKIRVHYVLTKINMFPPKDIITFFQELGVNAVSFNTLELKGNALLNRSRLYVKPLEYFNFIDSMYRDYSSYQVEVSPPFAYPLIIEYARKRYGLDIPFSYLGCPAVTTEMLILPDGAYLPCAALFTRKQIRDSLGIKSYSLSRMGIGEILRQPLMNRIVLLKRSATFKSYFPCRECKYLGNFCQPCFIESVLGQSLENPICTLAIKRLKESKQN